MHYLLIYDVVHDYVERRQAFRAEHLRLANEYASRGILRLGGALSEPVDQAVLWFDCEGVEPIEAFVANDPYVQNGLVLKHRIRPWNTVAGAQAVERPSV